MRKPRPEDYDPKYSASRKPRPEVIDLAGIVPVNKRSLERVNERTPEHMNARTDERSNERTPEQANTRTVDKKGKVRHSFQFFPEQIDALRKLRAEKALAGIQVDLSQLAREAFEQYLAKQRTDERSNK